MKTKFLGVFTGLISVLLLAACGAGGVKIPDLSGTDLDSAKTLVTNLGLVATVTEQYSDEVETGLVMKTNPPAGTTVDQSSKLKIIISKGPKMITSKDSQISWTNVSYYGSDDWNFSSPFIEDGKLKINCNDVKLAASINWREDQDNGYGYGLASITDTFDKSIPLKLLWDRKYVSYGQKQDLEIVIPVTDLDVKKPTTLYLKLYGEINGDDDTVYLTFNITW